MYKHKFFLKIVYALIVLLTIQKSAFSLDKKIVLGIERNVNELMPIIPKELTILYKRLGLNLKIKTLPALRTLVEIDSGQIDSVGIKIEQLEKKYKNIIMIPEPLVIDSEINIYRLKNQKENVAGIACPRGFYYCKLIKNSIELKVDFVTNTIEQQIQALKIGRVQYIVLVKLSYDLLKLKDLGIVEHKKVMKVNFHHYIHKSQAALKNKINNEIIKMKEEGYFKYTTEAAKNYRR